MLTGSTAALVAAVLTTSATLPAAPDPGGCAVIDGAGHCLVEAADPARPGGPRRHEADRDSRDSRPAPRADDGPPPRGDMRSHLIRPLSMGNEGLLEQLSEARCVVRSVPRLPDELGAIFVAARSVADPIAAMRGALARVEAGELDARVAVDDGSEVGLLQAGFNDMATGLAEREQIREAFGTYVDKEVAEHILREGTDLAGEEVEVTMMFIDIRNFTGFAERVTAPEVVATINRLFPRAVPIIHDHHGHVDKFVWDCVTPFVTRNLVDCSCSQGF